MNATELADEFKEENHDFNEDNLRHWGKQAATMLRQQQAEIEALKQQLVTTSSKAKLNYNKGHEDGRQLGIKQERAMWELAASTQEIMDTHPVKELNNGGEPIKNATYWKRQYNLMASQNDNLKSGLYHANEQIKYLESHPVKELTDEEIHQAITRGFGRDGFLSDGIFLEIKELLKKAQNKRYSQLC
jgi:hypothetical protein